MLCNQPSHLCLLAIIIRNEWYNTIICISRMAGCQDVFCDAGLMMIIGRLENFPTFNIYADFGTIRRIS